VKHFYQTVMCWCAAVFLSTLGGLTLVHAIRPAYIVLAGLGAGNLLLVIIAIGIICSYPLNAGAVNKNGVRGGGGGGGAVEHHEMTEKHRDDEDDFRYRDDGYDQQRRDDFYNDNETNDRRYPADNYDNEPPARVEDNPYFNNAEIQASQGY